MLGAVGVAVEAPPRPPQPAPTDAGRALSSGARRARRRTGRPGGGRRGRRRPDTRRTRASMHSSMRPSHHAASASRSRRDASDVGSSRCEYGFYSNVNPEVDHPRWTQATERRIGEFRRRKTLMFNGYGDQVASLYKGMDLKKFY